MELTIQSRINVDGTWWDVVTRHTVPDGLSSKDKVIHIKKVIKGLINTGEIISRVDGSFQGTGKGNGPEPAEAQAGDQSPIFTWPQPQCEIHREEMAVSKTQKTEGFVMFYCPKRNGQRYCTRRAKVDETNGHPSFWEVK